MLSSRGLAHAGTQCDHTRALAPDATFERASEVSARLHEASVSTRKPDTLGRNKT